MARLLALIRKEFLALLRDKASRMVLIGPPLIQLLVFSYAATFDLNNIPFVVINEDPGLAGREMVARFEGSPSFRQVAALPSTAGMADLIDHRAALLAIHVGRDFSRDLMIGRPAPLQIVIDGRNSNTAAIALSYASEIVLGFDADWAAAHGGRAAPATLEVRAWYNPNLLSRWFVVPGIVGLLTFVVTMLVSGLSVVREREAGTFDQLLVTPYRPWEILLGKAAPGLLIGAAEASVIVVVAVTWFGVPLIGSVVALALGLALFLVSAIGIGLMISSLAATQQQGLLGAFLFLVPAIILSGFATPIENMPRLVQYVTYLNPMRYLMVILRGTFLEGDGFVALLGQYWPLALLGAASMTAATALARRRMG
ncbi:ABC transporter permease [Rhodopila globiformis]|uniref:Antibiotic ABC transporter permease n=1 Tax=Rhodopila globiformis TaxID=1071 RepID=A0A2S6MTU9_RHOGL|nr:ABC transporter permease [Rhodopila globiformis]PPQ25786.1 antibiotic ABC transporter permease [Rhodopila globiformis]